MCADCGQVEGIKKEKGGDAPPPSEGADLEGYAGEPTNTSAPTSTSSMQKPASAMTADKTYTAKLRQRQYSRVYHQEVKRLNLKGASDGKAQEGAYNNSLCVCESNV